MTEFEINELIDELQNSYKLALEHSQNLSIKSANAAIKTPNSFAFNRPHPRTD